ncbi:MAG TPA: hypothetical protein VG326_19500 [Tepidisphaeraceae bacterium]|jgi:type II secretory pathway component PulK|nr:hypothetical protein [Tepidisphaeraceae bacterium]
MIRRRPGIIFITGMWVIVILCAIVLIFARSMRTEVAASSNRFSVQQANAVELGAEQYVLAAVDGCKGDAVTVLATPAEQIPIGNGYFWILQTYADNDYTYAFGITDESSKVNLNFSDAISSNNIHPSLTALPGLNGSQDVADSIVLWASGLSASKLTSGQGADTNYYQSLQRPYTLKGTAFESVEELFLVSRQDVTDQLMYGSDLDHNGMLDDNEQKVAGSLTTAFNAASDTTRGIFPFITVWGKESNPPKNPATDVTRVNVITVIPGSQLATIKAKLMPVLADLSLTTQNSIIQKAKSPLVPGLFKNVLDFAGRTGIKPEDFTTVAPNLKWTDQPTLNGLINVNTASQQVLATLPSVNADIAASLVMAREDWLNSGGVSGGSGASPAGHSTSYGWLLNTQGTTPLLTLTQKQRIGQLITAHSYFYSADIVAVSGEGRGFKRVRIVVNATNSPPVIIYRKDLTKLGWPLSPDILTALRKGQPMPAASGYGTGGANGLGQF